MRSARQLAYVGLALLAAVVAGGALYLWLGRDRTISVVIMGAERRVPAGTTVGEAADRFGLAPAAGALLDLQGAVLRPDAYPGHLVLDGHRARPQAKLVSGDRVSVVDGRSRTEPTTRFFVRVTGGMPSNPQFTLSRTPGRQELEKGRISGKIVPRGFDPSGPSRTPKAVALTFDDGPSPYTPQVLRVLQRMHARATFLVVGQWAKLYPRFVRQELAAGMEVGNHSYSHPYRPPFDRQPHAGIVREIRWGKAVVDSLGGNPKVFRPPGGAFSPYIVEVAGTYGQRILLWSVDPTDWKPGSTASEITKRVLTNVRAGSIVVLHDGGGDRAQTVKALPAIIRGIRKKGLELVLVDPSPAR